MRASVSADGKTPCIGYGNVATIIESMSHTERFTGRAAVYDRYRQRYPSEAIVSKLQRWCGLQADWVVADVGAGTGMLSEVFLANGNRVIAIEPNAEMRSRCEKLTTVWPQLEVLDGTAEASGLADASIDMVAAGRAFHWFETQPALKEFRRILKPGGWLTLVSLGRARAHDEQAVAFEHLLTEHGTDSHYVRGGYRVHDNLEEIFATDAQQAELNAERSVDWPTFLGEAMSFSITPSVRAPRFPGFQAALRSHFDKYAVDGALTLRTTCWISAGRIQMAERRVDHAGQGKGSSIR